MNVASGAPAIIVVGSMNVDLITYVSRIPDAGETRVGQRFELGYGGKGANQAVMAQRLGATVSMVGSLGDDAYGAMYRQNFTEAEVDTTFVLTVPGSTGVAPIWVEEDGTNRIIIVPGANASVTAEDVVAAIGASADAQFVIGQFEIPQMVTAAAFGEAKRRGSATVLNPAPGEPIQPALLAVTDWLVPNEVEFGLVGGGDPFDDAALAEAATEVGARLLVTLGAKGVALVTPDGRVVRHAAPVVEAVDTAGAGDAFVGSFVFGLAAGLSEDDAARLGVRCAADSVTRRGTQSSFPSQERCRELVSLTVEN